MIFYFSGTGNSAWVARQIAKAQQEELLAIAEEINKNKEYALKDGEKVGFVFPVYAWGPPGIVLRFIRQLKMKNPEYLFFVCTCGDDTGRTAQVFSSAIRRKGWHCVAGYSVTMPNTYVSLPGFDVDAEDVEEQKVQNAMARLDFINGELAGRIHMKRGVLPRFFHLLFGEKDGTAWQATLLRCPILMFPYRDLMLMPRMWRNRKYRMQWHVLTLSMANWPVGYT